MTAKRLRFPSDAHARICAGRDVLANAVGVTLGPKGTAPALAPA
jgi:hypothetical protein